MEQGPAAKGQSQDKKYPDEISRLNAALDELREPVTAQIDDLSEEIHIRGCCLAAAAGAGTRGCR